MKGRLRVAFSVTLFALTLGVVRPAAHHSFSAEFDADKPIALTGTITKMDWKNPHSWLYIDVTKSDGTVEKWAIEFASPATLVSLRGWKQDMLPEGSVVTVKGFLAKDGSRRANGSRVTIPAGKELCASACGTDDGGTGRGVVPTGRGVVPK